MRAPAAKPQIIIRPWSRDVFITVAHIDVGPDDFLALSDISPHKSVVREDYLRWTPLSHPTSWAGRAVFKFATRGMGHDTYAMIEPLAIHEVNVDTIRVNYTYIVRVHIGDYTLLLGKPSPRQVADLARAVWPEDTFEEATEMVQVPGLVRYLVNLPLNHGL